MSTVGLVDRLEEFAARPNAPHLALSLHATTDEVGARTITVTLAFVLLSYICSASCLTQHGCPTLFIKHPQVRRQSSAFTEETSKGHEYNRPWAKT